MKYLYILIITLIFPNYSFSQENTNNLAKYSYKCVTHDSTEYYTSTGFFYKKNGKTYLISNYHAITGYDVYKGVQDHEVDTMSIIVNNSNSETLKIPLNNKFIEPLKYYDKPDVKGILISPPTGTTLHYINDLVDPEYFNTIPEEAYFYGYPTRLQRLRTHIITSIHGHYDSVFTDKYVFGFDIPSNQKTQEQKNILKNVSLLYFLVDGEGEVGMSGSPVFGRYKVGSKSIYKFIGIFCAYNPNSKNSLIARATAIDKYILKKLH